MTFGPDPSSGARITSEKEYATFLDHLQAAGYNEVDTARSYVGGKQEAFTREAGWKDRGLTLATKVYPDVPGKHAPKVLTEQFNISLRELGTDCVDIFYLHAAVRPALEFLEPWLTHGIGSLGSFHRDSWSCWQAPQAVSAIFNFKQSRKDVLIGPRIGVNLFNLAFQILQHLKLLKL